MGDYSERDAQRVVLLGSSDGGTTWAPVEDPAGGGAGLTEPVTVDDGGGSLTVDGTVAVSNFPATQPVSGTVDIGTMPTVTVSEPVSIDDNGGSITVDGSVSVGNFPATYPVTDNGGSLTVDGTVTVQDGGGTISVDDGGTTLSIDDGGGSITVDGTVVVSNMAGGSVPETWVATADAVAPAANKYMLTLLNGSGSGKVIKIVSLRLVPLTLTAVTGVGLRMEVKRISAHAAGTGVTPVALDTNNTALPAQITAYTNSASVVDVSLLWPYTVNNDEIGLTSTTSTPALWLANLAIGSDGSTSQPITLREGQGLALKNITSSVVGTFAVVAIFTVA